MELVVGIVLVAVVLGVAAYFGRAQLAVLHGAVTDMALPTHYRRFLLKQAYRRLFGSALMLAFGAMLAGWLFIAPQVGAITPAPAGGPLGEEARETVRFLFFYWAVALLILLGVMSLAVFDFWATARYSHEQQRQLEQDRSSMLKDEVSRLRQRRSERN